jgi:hypothetical protein
MALRKQEILQRIFVEMEPGKWNVAKPRDSEDLDTECILRRKITKKFGRWVLENRSNLIYGTVGALLTAVNVAAYCWMLFWMLFLRWL